MNTYKYTINGTKYEVVIGEVKELTVTVSVNGEEYQVEMEKPAEPEKKKPIVRPVAAAEPTNSDAGEPKQAVNKNDALKAPLPGVITEIAEVGRVVSAGDTVAVLEAMKMANNLQAEKSGTVTAVFVKPGESVMEDDALLVIE